MCNLNFPSPDYGGKQKIKPPVTYEGFPFQYQIEVKVVQQHPEYPDHSVCQIIGNFSILNTSAHKIFERETGHMYATLPTAQLKNYKPRKSKKI